MVIITSDEESWSVRAFRIEGRRLKLARLRLYA